MSSAVSRVCDDDCVQAVMFAVGIVVGSGITVCIMRRNVQRLEEYVELLRQEVRRLRIAVDDHLAIFDGTHGVFNNSNRVSSYPTPPPSPDPHQTPCGSTLTLTNPSTPRSHKGLHRHQSPRRQGTSKSTSRPPCRSPPSSSASNSVGEECFSPRDRSDNLQSVSLDDTTHDPRGGSTAATPSTPTKDTDLAQMFCNVDQLLDGSDYDKHDAYNILVNKSKNRQMLQNANFMWRLAKATYFVSQLEGSNNNKMKQKNLVYKSRDIAGKALQIDNDNPDAHKWWAITLGSIGEYEGTTTKIQNGFEFKKHIEKSIELNPSDASSHHLLGRWCYRVYMLPWMERKVAAALFATPPTASIEDALTHFQKAELITPDKWKENQLYIAKCFVEKKDYRKAVFWLQKATQIAVKNHSDEECQQEVDNLLTQYRGHRM